MNDEEKKGKINPSQASEQRPVPAESVNSEAPTYRQMLAQVEAICRDIGAPDLDLDQMISKVEKGYQLIKLMRERLDGTREKIDRLRVEMETPERS